MHGASIVADAQVSSRTKNDLGILFANAAVTRPGIVEYTAKELGLSNRDGTVRVMRTPETVFHADTIATLRGAAVTIGHPEGAPILHPGNWREHAVGTVIGEPVKAAGDLLEARIQIGDREAIDALEQSGAEVSIGYDMKYVEAEPGLGYEFETKGPLKVNHVALVPKGRAGSDVRVYDSGGEDMTDADIGKLTTALSNNLAEAVAKGMADAGKAGGEPAFRPETLAPILGSAVADAVKPLQEQIDEIAKQRQADLAERKAADAKAQADAAANKLVEATRTEERARASILADALPLVSEDKRAALQNADTKTILVAAVGDSLPDAANQSEDFLRGVLAARKMAAATQPQNQLVGDRLPQPGGVSASDKARDEYVNWMQEAYKQGETEEVKAV